jgi:hypothetical protein
MKYIPIPVLCVIFLLSCAGAPDAASPAALPLDAAIERAARELDTALPPDARVAVTRVTSMSNAMSDYLMDELAGALVNAGLVVADRDSLELVYREQGFHTSGNVSDETAVSLGRLLGARSVITADLVDTGAVLRLRVNSLGVETSRQEFSARYAVAKDRDFAALLSALNAGDSVSKDAGY